MKPKARLLARWYAGQHLDPSDFHYLGLSSLPWFAQQMRTDPAGWLRRDWASRTPLVVQRVRSYV